MLDRKRESSRQRFAVANELLLFILLLFFSLKTLLTFFFAHSPLRRRYSTLELGNIACLLVSRMDARNGVLGASYVHTYGQMFSEFKPSPSVGRLMTEWDEGED